RLAGLVQADAGVRDGPAPHRAEDQRSSVRRPGYAGDRERLARPGHAALPYAAHAGPQVNDEDIVRPALAVQPLRGAGKGQLGAVRRDGHASPVDEQAAPGERIALDPFQVVARTAMAEGELEDPDLAGVILQVDH